jgi:hypothetical protein
VKSEGSFPCVQNPPQIEQDSDNFLTSWQASGIPLPECIQVENDTAASHMLRKERHILRRDGVRCLYLPTSQYVHTCWVTGFSRCSDVSSVTLEFKSQVFLECLPTHSLTHEAEPTIVQLLENFPALYGTRRFITVFTNALHWSLSWARSIQSYLSKIHFNIVHPPTPWFSQWSLSIWLSHQYLYVFLFSRFVLHALPISSSLTWLECIL